MRFQVAFVALFALAIASAYTPYQEFTPFSGPYSDNCPAVTSEPKWLTNLKNSLSAAGVLNRLVTDKPSLLTFAEDYGHWVHRAPLAAFAATSAQDVSALLKTAYASRSKGSDWAFQVVNRGGSGNTNGYAQPYCGAAQVVLDLTAINQTSVSKNFLLPSTAWVGAGANWESFVIATRDQGLRPTVVPDYLGISVGGIVSIGGLGGDAARVGPIVNQILAAQIVQPDGDIEVVSFGSPYFAAMKGGMGNFGVFIKFQFILTKQEPVTRVFHVLVPTFSAMSVASRYVINNGFGYIADTIQAFGVANDRVSISQSVAPEAQLAAVNNSVNRITANGKRYVYYLEFLVRGSGNDLPTVPQVQRFFGNRVNPDLIFYTDYDTFSWDNRLEINTIPFLVSIGAWQAPHPWGVFNFDATAKTESYVDNYLQGQRQIEDLGFGLIALYPFPASNAFTFSSAVGVSDTRGQDIFWHTTLGRTAALPPGTSPDVVNAVYNGMANQNRILWDGFAQQGSSAAFYPCGVLPNTTPDDWKRHFSPVGYTAFKLAKQTLDSKNVFADLRNIF